jgi:hypothetical protein
LTAEQQLVKPALVGECHPVGGKAGQGGASACEHGDHEVVGAKSIGRLHEPARRRGASFAGQGVIRDEHFDPAQRGALLAGADHDDASVEKVAQDPLERRSDRQRRLPGAQDHDSGVR